MKKLPKAIDLTGLKFGKLTAVKYMYSDNSKKSKRGRFWLCECECGGYKIANACDLRRGSVTSCGCLRKDNIKKAQEANITHGMCTGKRSRLYQCYQAMKRRCQYEPNWVNKGINVCKEWQSSPQAFFNWAISNGYQDNLTLDRIDVYGDYEPANCRWISKHDQQLNKTTNHFVTINGITKTISQWSEISGVSAATISKRIEHGFDGTDLIVPTGSIYRTSSKKRSSYKRLITINGKTQSIADWHKETGLSAAMIQQRVNRGFAGEEIIAPRYTVYHGNAICNLRRQQYAKDKT